MCEGVAFFANNKKALYGKGTNSHSDSAKQLKINEDDYRKYEYLWWEKKIQQVHYDQVAEDILARIDEKKAFRLVELSVKKHFNTDTKLVKWLKEVPNEWDKLLEPKWHKLSKRVNPLLLTFQDKIEKFKKTPIENYNPYQATKLPKLKEIKKSIPKKVRDQVGNQVWNQVWNQVRDQVWNQVWNQVGNQVGTTSYWAVKIVLGLPIKHWFFEFIKLGIMIVFVEGKAKIFGKKGKYLGEYNEKDLF